MFSLVIERTFVYDMNVSLLLSDAVDQLVGVDVGDLADAALGVELRELCRAIDRLEHRRAVLITAIHGRGIPDGVGAVSTPAWVQHETGLPRATPATH